MIKPETVPDVSPEAVGQTLASDYLLDRSVDFQSRCARPEFLFRSRECFLQQGKMPLLPLGRLPPDGEGVAQVGLVAAGQQEEVHEE